MSWQYRRRFTVTNDMGWAYSQVPVRIDIAWLYERNPGLTANDLAFFANGQPAPHVLRLPSDESTLAVFYLPRIGPHETIECAMVY